MPRAGVSRRAGPVSPVMVEERVDEDAAHRDEEPHRKRHACDTTMAREVLAPCPVDGRKREGYDRRGEHDVRNEERDAYGVQPRRPLEVDRSHLGMVDEICDQEGGR